MLPADPAVAGEEKLRALEEVLRSRTLARSEQLQGFLRYICEMELAGRGDEISEYSIATAALNRKSDYAPGEDSSVRSRAHALRRKLQEYYESESPETDWRIELPKGSYRPLFVHRNSAPPQVATVVKSTDLRSKQIARSQVRPFLLGVFVALLISVLLVNHFRPDPVDPIVREAWGPLLQAGSDNLILIGIPPLTRIIPSQPGMLPNGGRDAVLAPESVANWYERLKLTNRGGPVYLSPTRGYIGFNDNLAAVAATTIIGVAGATYQVAPEPLIRPIAMHARGLVVIGSPSYTPHIARILRATPYSIQFDPELNDEVIANGPPGSANRRIFAVKRDAATDRFSTVYGLITVLPAQPGRERPERTIIFSGVKGSPGAHAAALFFTTPSALLDLQKRFRQQGYKQFPSAYQVIVRCGVDAEAAMNTVYETHQVMATPPVIE